MNNMQLKSKERLKLYEQGGEVDRVPCTMSIGETAPFLYGIKMDAYYFSSQDMVEVESRLAEDFGLDNMGAGIGLRGVAEALGTKLAYSPDNISYVDQPILKGYAILDAMDVVNPYKDGRLPIVLEANKILADRYRDAWNISVGIAAPLSMVAALCGTEDMMRDMIRDKENLHRALEFSVACILECARVFYHEAGAMLSLSDPVSSANLLSVGQYREFVKPYLKQTVEGIQKITGFRPGLHVCGRTKDRWNDIAECGVKSFSVDNCEDLLEVKRAIGDKVGIAGNVAPVDVMKNGSTRQIMEQVKKCILDCSDSPGGFTLMPGCQVPMKTPMENIKTFMQTAWLYGRGAKKGCLCKGVTG